MNVRLLLKWVYTYEIHEDWKCVQMSAIKYRASVPCSVRTKFIRRKLIHSAAVATNQTHATRIARRRVWQTHICSLNALVPYFVVALRSVKIGVGADQKDFLGDWYAENRRHMASEGKKIQRKETLNRHIPYNNVDSVVWHFFVWQKLRSPITVDIGTRIHQATKIGTIQ